MKGTFVALNLNKSSVSQCGNLPLNLRTPKLVMNLERLGSLSVSYTHLTLPTKA